jgi:hypothetical protein
MINVLVCILVAYLCVSPFFYAKAVKFGIKLADKPEEAAEEPTFHVPTPKKKPKMSAQEDRITQILSNIDNYNGTPVGQKKVEVKING